MIPQATIQNSLLAASLKVATMVNYNLTQITNGNQDVAWGAIKRAQRGVNSVQRQYNLGDYGSSRFLTAYGCLQNFVGAFGAGTINPNAQNPGTVIQIEGGNGLNISGPIFFNTQTVTISNWQDAYAATYGNYPDIDIFDMDGFPQTSTTAQRKYPGDDPTQPLDYITWGYPVVTHGYYIIKGQNPNVSGGGGGGITPPTASLPITNNSAVLLDDATLNSLYPLALWGQLILLPNVPAKYEKLDNSPTGQWDLQTYTPNS